MRAFVVRRKSVESSNFAEWLKNVPYEGIRVEIPLFSLEGMHANDGTFLSLAQIKSLPNVFGGVELLTLSACNTATGGSGANGKEVEGFGVLAQRQGAKAVVASLWPVADRSTKVLMQDFYRLREARAGTSKASALRHAQLELLRVEGPTEVVTTKVRTPVMIPVATADRQIVHEEKPEAANKPRFTPDPKKPYAHPYYWAPFILIGNWK